jgi:hypothetical protein
MAWHAADSNIAVWHSGICSPFGAISGQAVPRLPVGIIGSLSESWRKV